MRITPFWDKILRWFSVIIKTIIRRWGVFDSVISNTPMQKNDIFIFTEIYRCGKIGKISIESFVKHHPKAFIHVFGTPADFAWISKHPNIFFVDLSGEEKLLNAFNQGHLGTATLWARIIQDRPEKYIIHIDSDLIFRAEAISDISKRFAKGFNLVGYIRNYKHNPNNRDDVRHLSDVVQTAFFGFNRQKISQYPLKTLIKMCQGGYNPLRHPTIDFFDPVMFDILKNGGKVSHLSQADYGGCNLFGKRDSIAYPKLNRLIDFGHKSIHFSAVGSGMNFYEHPKTIRNIPDTYKNYAIEKYALFCKLYYDESLDFPIDHGTLAELTKALKATPILRN